VTAIAQLGKRAVVVSLAVFGTLLFSPLVEAAQADHCQSATKCNHAEVTPGQGGFETEIIVPDGHGGGKTLGGKGNSCPGCQWILTPACSQNEVVTGPDGNPIVFDALCGAAVNSCRGAGILFRVYVRRPPSTQFDFVDTVCHGGAAGAPTRQQLLNSAGGSFRDLVPVSGAGVHWQPTNGAVTGVPAIFYATGERAVSGSSSAFGMTVSVTARPTQWVWHVAPGVDVTSSVAGGPYPEQSAEYLYTRTGRYAVSVTTTWSGFATIAGVVTDEPVGAVQVTSPVRDLTVREGRTELIDG
jgi:hypothetical protein